MKRMLSVLLSILFLLTALPLGAIPVTAATTSGTTGDCTWTLDDDGHLTISGNGAMENYDINAAPWKGSKITSVTIEYGVTTIGDFAFDTCTSLTSVTIPDSVTTIGGDAFDECTSLQKVTIGLGVIDIEFGAFDDCPALTDVFYPGSESEFAQIRIGSVNNYLLNANFHYNVCAMGGDHVWDGDYDLTCNQCSYWRNVTVTEGPLTFTLRRTEEGDVAHVTTCSVWTHDVVEIPNTVAGMPVVAIENRSFYECVGVTAVTIPNSVTIIGDEAFRNCDALTSVTIPDSVTTIGNSAFEDCNCLESVTIPNGVTTIGNSAFEHCDRLESVTIPDSVTTIGSWAFSYCHSLASVTIGRGVIKIGNSAFFMCDFQTVIIPDGVTTIGGSVFSYCYSLVSVTLPSSVTAIGENAFVGCTSLDTVFYGGDAADRDAITVAGGNSVLYLADWYFNICAPDAHQYTAACDPACDRCQWTRGTVPHTYDDAFDPTCNACGTVRVVAGEDEPRFVVEDVTACYDSTFTVAVRVEKNPGVVAFRLNVHYDTNLLELISAEEGVFADVTYGPTYAAPFTFTWCDAISPDNTTNGTVVWLTFRAKEGTDLIQTGIAVTYDAEDVYNSRWESVRFGTTDGAVILAPPAPGDANGDGKVNVRDIGLMQQHMNGWDVELNLDAADVNGDGKVNVRDLGLLQQYINGWDVTLGG